MRTQVFSETRVTQSQTQTPQLWTWCTRFPQDQTQALQLPEINQGILADGIPVPRTEVRVRMEEDPPPTVQLGAYIFMHQG
jgi:hypothetical protein